MADTIQHPPFLSILKQYWGYDSFRGIQQQIIESIAQGRDTLGLMPTGGGKSITFQVPALAMEGVCIVITPLIALMKDQVQHLRRAGIQAAAIYSGLSHDEVLKHLENSIFGGVKLLYVSPERLSSELFLTKLRRMKVSFITVDEAHCISQWGYDFRPSYLEIASIRRLVNKGQPTPVLALTATATPLVVSDIQQRLQFAEPNVFQMSFERRNLAYVVRRTDDKGRQLLHILQSVAGSAIVYVRSRKRTKELADFLNAHLPSAAASAAATCYHAGLDHAVRDERQTAWQQGRIRVIVATNAFGMGIDKPDVRLVIHYDAPSSLEEYFQEAGRAGRDGAKAYAVLLFEPRDRRALLSRVHNTFPPKAYILQVYEHLAYYYQMAVGDGLGVTRPFDLSRFCATYRHFPVQAHAALTILSLSGLIHYDTEPDNATRVMFLIQRHELYRLTTLSPHEDAVITALLRLYGGLFTDYGYISLPQVAQAAHVTPDQVYLCLQALSQRRIVHFIPQRTMPTVTWTQRRVPTERLVILPSVYEERRERFSQRIGAMLSYIERDDTCRSRMLLEYFGETRAADCGQCDVCLTAHNQKEEGEETPAAIVPSIDERSDMVSEAEWAGLADDILNALADGQPHRLSDLQVLLSADNEYAFNYALRRLLSEEVVVLDGLMIVKNHNETKKITSKFNKIS